MKLPRVVTIGGKLAVICIIAAVVLALINAVTAPVIVENRARALREGLLAVAREAELDSPVLGEQVAVESVDQVNGYYPLLQDGAVAGYVVQLVGVGYGGDMALLAGYYPDGELFGARLMENQETPGLGKKAEDPGYMDMFLGHGGTDKIPVQKGDLDPQVADAITGATITFLGVARALAAGSEFVSAGAAEATSGGGSLQ